PPGWNVEAQAKRQATRKHQRLVDLKKVHVRPHLNGAVTVVLHLDLDRLTVHVGLNGFRAQDIFPRNHHFSSMPSPCPTAVDRVLSLVLSRQQRSARSAPQ